MQYCVKDILHGLTGLWFNIYIKPFYLESQFWKYSELCWCKATHIIQGK